MSQYRTRALMLRAVCSLKDLARRLKTPIPSRTGSAQICASTSTRRFTIYFPVFLAAIIGVALSLLAWHAMSILEGRADDVEFRTRANNTALMLQDGMYQSLDKLMAFRALFESAEDVTRAEFDTFASEVLPSQSAIVSVSWVPRVKSGERALLESQAVQEGLTDFKIRTLTPSGTVVAQDKEEYFPIFYATGRDANSVYGLDLNDGGPRQDALERARDGDRFAATDPIILQMGPGNRSGFVVALPIYDKGLAHNTLARKRQHLHGFIVGVFQTSLLVNAALKSVDVPLDLYFYAPGNNNHRSSVHVLPSRPDLRLIQVAALDDVTSSEHWRGTLKVADKDWTLVAKPIFEPWLLHSRAWIILVAGFMVTTIAAAYLWSSIRQTLRLVSANAKITHLAKTDMLTSLANRSAFLECLLAAHHEATAQTGSYGILCFDIDHFKDVNDSLGHAAGDQLLRNIAERILGVVSGTDFVARFGGDEFAVLQGPQSDDLTAGELAQRIIAAVALPYSINGNTVRVTASIGIAHLSDASIKPESAMMQADLALYRAKEDGRNCYRFHSKVFDEQEQERIRIGEDLRNAIERSEIELHYQPQVELTSGNIIGLEALVRWNHPTRGRISPGVFIPIAERTGLIVALGRWIFDEACRHAKSWHDQGIAPPTIAVNVSAIQCKEPSLEKDITDSMARWAVDPSWMEIELTESVLMEATQQTGDIIHRLRRLGVRIAIDDFGTGYSSLSYLTSYPVDRLKIAQQLLVGVPSEQRHAVVVRTAISLAHELGIQCIAEGIETPAQALFLVASNCRHGQGYYFSKPVDFAEISRLLKSGVAQETQRDMQTSLQQLSA